MSRIRLFPRLLRPECLLVFQLHRKGVIVFSQSFVQSKGSSVARKLSVVIPAKNEATNIGLVLDDVNRTIAQIPGYEVEVLVVDDNSTDRTGEAAREHGARVVRNTGPSGKGRALRLGFKNAGGDVIVMMDADCSHRAEEIPAFLDAMKNGVGLIIGSRVFGGSEEYTSIRAFGNVFLTAALGLFLGRYLSDPLNGFKAFRRDIFDEFHYTSRAFEIEIELIANALRKGYRVVEICSHERARRAGEAKSRVLGHGLRFFWRVFTEWLRNNGLLRSNVQLPHLEDVPMVDQFLKDKGLHNYEMDRHTRLVYHPLFGMFFKHRFVMALKMFNGFRDQPLQCLVEVGYSVGLLLPSLAKMGRQVVGVDTIDSAAAVAVRNMLCKQGVNNVCLLQGSVVELPLRNGSVDGLLCLSVLEHLQPGEELGKAAKELYRVLRPGGIAVVGFPVKNRLTRLLLEVAGVEEQEVHPSSHTDIVKKFRHQGFQIEGLRCSPAFLPLDFGLYGVVRLRRAA